MLLFSATYDTEVMKFAQAVISQPIVIRLRREEESLDNIKQFYIKCNRSVLQSAQKHRAHSRDIEDKMVG